jgi:phosphoglycolate phosphatase-like HAD superfamily hydrolase
MPAPHLVMFDVDGTLVQSMGPEAVLFPQACELTLGIGRVSNDWNSYRSPTDAGIVTELVERHLCRTCTAEDRQRVEDRFLALMRDAIADDPGTYCEVSGAAALLATLRARPDTILAIATGGWGTTARLKLSAARLEVEDVPLASSHDAEAKEAIMRVALERAQVQADCADFASLTYLGDTPGDARASAKLGFHFIGIDTSGWVRDAPRHFADFSNHEAVMTTLLDLRQQPAPSATRPDPG